MTEAETAETINDRATEWVARIDRSELDPDERAELEAWLAGDPRRRGAFLRARAAWGMLDRARVLASGRPEDVEFLPTVRWSRRRVIGVGSALAAAAAMAAGGAFLLLPRSQETIETAVGEIRRVPLRDGSMAAVNTQTKLAVALDPELRSIELDRGEAWFQVARDERRPFVVAAGNVRVRAVGTAFSVRRFAGGADVQVTEGVVRAWTLGAEENAVRVAAGARAFVSDEAGPPPPVEASADIDRRLAWRAGQIILDGDTLAQAAAEFNRYNHAQIVIDDPSIAGERLVGRFRTNEPDAFARAAAGMLGGRAVIGPGEIRLSGD